MPVVPRVPKQPDPIAVAWNTIIKELGYSALNPHLLASPERVARFLRAWHTPLAKPPKMTTFPRGQYAGMVVTRAIPFYSVCAHHGLPFHGSAVVGYVPGAEIVGLSKLARVVDYFAHRFQTQEDLTAQVAEFLEAELKPRGVGVIVESEHLCMSMRGIERPGHVTATSELRGVLRDDAAARAEFLALAGKP